MGAQVTDRPYVFISHASADKASLRKLIDALIAANIPVWIDDPFDPSLGYARDDAGKFAGWLGAGTGFQPQIDAALREAVAIVGVFSQQVVARLEAKDSRTREVLYEELTFARTAARLFACRIDDSDRGAYPHRFGDEKIVDVRGDADLATFIDSIRQCVAVAAATPARAQSAALRSYVADRVRQLETKTWGVKRDLFTPLSLLVPRFGAKGEVDVSTADQKFEDLSEIVAQKLASAGDHATAVAILGAPGSGKSTILRRFELDMSAAALAKADVSSGPICFFVELNRYNQDHDHGRAPPEPLDWLRQQWDSLGQTYPGLPALDQVLKGESFLLLDALNEMGHRDKTEYDRLFSKWATFITEVRQRFPACRLLFTCRDQHFAIGLNRKNEPSIPLVRIEPLDDARIERFLTAYGASHFLESIRGTRASNENDQRRVGGMADLYNTPYFLRILIDFVPSGAAIPANRAALFTTLVQGRLSQEWSKTGRAARKELVAPLLEPDDVEKVDRVESNQASWAEAFGEHALPDGELFSALARVAYRMQQNDDLGGAAAADRRRSITLRFGDFERMLAQSGIPKEKARKIFDAAADLSLLSHDWISTDGGRGAAVPGTVRFEHQLIQEYFAGKFIAENGGLKRVGHARRAPWREREVEDVPEGLPDKDPLPPMNTSWDETMLFAAQMAEDRSAFIGELMILDLPLAGRAAAQVGAKLDEAFKQSVREALLKRMRDEKAHLRARAAAGNALGELGDHRFRRERTHVVAPTVTIPAGAYQIGDGRKLPDWTTDHKAQRHKVRVKGFAIGRHLVTNAEWRCFMDAGGYDDERWWKPDASNTWRLGPQSAGGTAYQCWADMWRIFKEWLQAHPDLATTLKDRGEISADEADNWIKWSRKGEAAEQDFRDFLEKDLKLPPERRERDKRFIAPAGFIAAFDNPSQPVVGVNWYEATAYCAWLSAETGERWRLPTEAEWEIAARYKASDDWRYPWGKAFEDKGLFSGGRSQTRANTIYARIRATTPVGMFPGGDTRSGLCDMSGNALEWTSTIHRDYPYSADREDMSDGESLRVVRGGSWYYGRAYAMLPFRFGYHPGFRARTAGFRLARDM
jgi:formylglycine-generating enzyme required for sulfatase activity